MKDLIQSIFPRTKNRESFVLVAPIFALDHKLYTDVGATCNAHIRRETKVRIEAMGSWSAYYLDNAIETIADLYRQIFVHRGTHRIQRS